MTPCDFNLKPGYRHVECNLCGSSDAEEFALAYGGLEKVLHRRRVRCRQCGLVYSNPQATPEKLRSYYAETYPAIDYPSYPAGIEKQIHPMRRAFSDLNRRLKPGRYLDIGCAHGLSLMVARDFGWDPYGIELSEVFADFARERLGLKNIFVGDLHDTSFEGQFFDCIHMWHVLEHVTDPLGALREIHRILKNGGLFRLGVPNIDEPYKNLGRFVARLKGHVPSISTGDFHTYDFAPATMRRMLNEAGFKIKELSLSYRPLGDVYYNGSIAHRNLKVFFYYLGKLAPNRFGNFMGVWAVKREGETQRR